MDSSDYFTYPHNLVNALTFPELQCIHKVFTLLNLFHILVCYSLIPKLLKFILFLTILQTIPHIDKMKEDCLKSLQIYYKI